jgi:DNA-binding transcriptional MerR regulator
MQEKKVYSVAELAEKVGVPRTTITDWLNRFAQYMESEMRGKRKVFTEAALAVLVEIAKLRDLGRSTYEIESDLAARHPVQAEIHQEPPPPPSSASAPVEPSVEAGADTGALVAPAARLQAEELVRLMNGELKGLAQSLEQNQADAAKFARKAFRWQCGVAVLLLLLAVAAGAAALLIYNHIAVQNSRIDSGNRQLNDLQLSTSLLVDELKKREGQIGEQGRKLDDMVVTLDRSREDYRRNVEKLSKELREQQAVFEVELKKQSENAAGKHQSELTRMREDFAARQLEFLRQQEKIAAMRDEIAKNEQSLKAASEKLERREQQLRDREKQLNPPSDKPETAAKPDEQGAKAADVKPL